PYSECRNSSTPQKPSCEYFHCDRSCGRLAYVELHRVAYQKVSHTARVSILESVFYNAAFVVRLQPLISYGRSITEDRPRPAHREAARALPVLRKHRSLAQRDTWQENRDRAALALRIMQAH